MVLCYDDKHLYLKYILVINTNMKRYIFREEAKCNFCSEWFVVFNEIKYPLKICENCINKAIHTSYFKVPGPNHDLYQVYLVKKHTQIN